MSTPKLKRRPTLTFKGSEFTPVFRRLLNTAAKKRGMTQAAFAAEVLDREARRALTGNPPSTPDGTPRRFPEVEG